MRVIFLDVDGVLNSSETRAKIDGLKGVSKKNLRILRHIVARTQAKIVLTSAWNINFDEKLVPTTKAGMYLYHRLWENNLWIYDKVNDYGGNREQAVAEYVKKHNNLTDWVIIDDTHYGDYEKLNPKHIVYTSPALGLTKASATEAIVKLGCTVGTW
nr:MAG TPA: HAD domain protein [Caudoviricetes sp.]